MTTFDDLVREVRESLRGYGLIKDRVAFLSGSINASAVAVDVDDPEPLQAGVVEIDDECLFVRDISSSTLLISPDGRGWQGTIAASHAANARVVYDPAFPSWRIQRAINDTIVGTYPTLWGVATTTFTFSPTIYTYSLPADAESVLSVSTTVIGPDQQQYPIRGFAFEPNANTTQFATGKCITLHEEPSAGQTVTVVYAKAPTELSSGQALTASGLRETARRCIIYGAVSELLSFVDATRSLTESAINQGFSDVNRAGTATQLAAQLTARYQMELNAEQSRLRQQHKPSVVWRGR